ncbi:MAG: hypothetical protein NTNFB02_28150 [Nitrospira sp.]
MLRKSRTLNGERASILAYCRVMRIGSHITVSAMAMDGNGDIVGPNDPYIQTAQCLRNIEAALAEEGASLADVVKTRVCVADSDHGVKINRAYDAVFRRFFSAARIEVRRFMLPEILVEIEVDAVIAET